VRRSATTARMTAADRVAGILDRRIAHPCPDRPPSPDQSRGAPLNRARATRAKLPWGMARFYVSSRKFARPPPARARLPRTMTSVSDAGSLLCGPAPKAPAELPRTRTGVSRHRPWSFRRPPPWVGATAGDRHPREHQRPAAHIEVPALAAAA